MLLVFAFGQDLSPRKEQGKWPARTNAENLFLFFSASTVFLSPWFCHHVRTCLLDPSAKQNSFDFCQISVMDF